MQTIKEVFIELWTNYPLGYAPALVMFVALLFAMGFMALSEADPIKAEYMNLVAKILNLLPIPIVFFVMWHHSLFMGVVSGILAILVKSPIVSFPMAMIGYAIGKKIKR